MRRIATRRATLLAGVKKTNEKTNDDSACKLRRLWLPRPRKQRLQRQQQQYLLLKPRTAFTQSCRTAGRMKIGTSMLSSSIRCKRVSRQCRFHCKRSPRHRSEFHREGLAGRLGNERGVISLMKAAMQVLRAGQTCCGWRPRVWKRRRRRRRPQVEQETLRIFGLPLECSKHLRTVLDSTGLRLLELVRLALLLQVLAMLLLPPLPLPLLLLSPSLPLLLLLLRPLRVFEHAQLLASSLRRPTCVASS